MCLWHMGGPGVWGSTKERFEICKYDAATVGGARLMKCMLMQLVVVEVR